MAPARDLLHPWGWRPGSDPRGYEWLEGHCREAWLIVGRRGVAESGGRI